MIVDIHLIAYITVTSKYRPEHQNEKEANTKIMKNAFRKWKGCGKMTPFEIETKIVQTTNSTNRL